MFFIEFQGHFHVVCGSSSGYYGDFSLDFTDMKEVTLTLLCRCCGSSQCAYKRSHLNRNILWGEKNCFNWESSRKSGFFGHLKENAFALIAAVIWSREMHLCITEYYGDRRTATDQVHLHPACHLWTPGGESHGANLSLTLYKRDTKMSKLAP